MVKSIPQRLLQGDGKFCNTSSIHNVGILSHSPDAEISETRVRFNQELNLANFSRKYVSRFFFSFRYRESIYTITRAFQQIFWESRMQVSVALHGGLWVQGIQNMMIWISLIDTTREKALESLQHFRNQKASPPRPRLCGHI